MLQPMNRNRSAAVLSNIAIADIISPIPGGGAT
jgi:hypothetical protein